MKKTLKFLIINLFLYQTVWGAKIPYDPQMEEMLIQKNYALQPVMQISEDKKPENSLQKLERRPLVKLPLTLKVPQQYDQEETEACNFFSRICAMLLSKKGKTHLKSMFLGQDDDFVYIKFPSPQPFGIKNIEDFLENFRGVCHQRFDLAQHLVKTVYKVDKAIILEHKPLAELTKASPWFRLLAAAYQNLIEFMEEEEEASEDEDMGDFDFPATELNVTYSEGGESPLNSTTIDILSGKPVLFDLDVKEAFDKKEFLKDFHTIFDNPIVNNDGFHARALCISRESIRFFNTLESEKGVRTSKMFDSRLSLNEIKELIQKTQPLLSALLKDNQDILHEMGKGNSDRAVLKMLSDRREQTLLEIAQVTRLTLPEFDSYQSVDIFHLSAEEFMTRLYAELMQEGFFHFKILDL
jgi:hypothetical protein